MGDTAPAPTCHRRMSVVPGLWYTGRGGVWAGAPPGAVTSAWMWRTEAHGGGRGGGGGSGPP